MTMTLDSQQRHHIGGMGYDQLPYTHQPQFSNPWGAGTSSSHRSSQLYPSAMSSGMTYDSLSKPQESRSSMPLSFNPLPVTASATNQSSYATTAYPHSELLNSSQDLLGSTRSTYDSNYSTAPQQPTSYSTSGNGYASANSYNQPMQLQQPDRSLPHSSAPLSQTHASAFNTDTLDGARHMVAMSQTDITPRNIYGPRAGDRTSTSSYGFPATHSSHSSVSSSNGYPAYFAGSSVEGSVSDYSSASESLDGSVAGLPSGGLASSSAASRRLPRPQGFVASSMPPAPQSMMGSFSSKVVGGTQKKHKCKVCDKRFTRPSSLQTHMYSHTGEKPFACDYDGCGRNFSVVSNLRRHRKVHKGEQVSDHGSPEGSWTSRD